MPDWDINRWLPDRKTLGPGKDLLFRSPRFDSVVSAELILLLDTGFTLVAGHNITGAEPELLICKGTDKIIAFYGRSRFNINPTLEPNDHWSRVAKRALDSALSYIETLNSAGRHDIGANTTAFAYGSKRLGDSLNQLNWLAYILEQDMSATTNRPILYISHQNLLIDPLHIIDTESKQAIHVDSLSDAYTDAAQRGITRFFMGTRWIPSNPSRMSRIISDKYSDSVGDSIPPDSFAMVISLDLEKRKWVNQVEVLKECIRIAKGIYGDIRIILNGMCAPIGGMDMALKAIVDFEVQVFNEIVSGLGPDSSISLSGLTFESKIPVLARANFFVVPLGTPSLILSHLLRKPGMVVCNKEFARNQWHKQHTDAANWIPDESMLEDIDSKSLGMGDLSHFGARTYTLTSYRVNAEAFLADYRRFVSSPSLLAPHI